MNEYLYDKLLILNTVYNNTIQPSKTINQSNAIKTPLLNHQLQMINYMHLYRDRMIRGFLSSNKTINGKLGILGEPSGTGKTLTVLSYIASIIEPPTKFSLELENSSNKYFFSHNLYEVNNQRSTNLIIVPHSLFTQWNNEATTHTTLKFVPLETRRFIKGDDLATNITINNYLCPKYESNNNDNIDNIDDDNIINEI
jgi:SNF2 family DNA or RNA helicase